ncbi:unnamed protein product [Urochloa decumbens]|uniref:Uncharacterized protein n=1 Tax=Urochloa decumbens TaxID=240449 RepID=A0ABC9A4W4_9POAL
MELREPLLQDDTAHERGTAAAAALAVKLHGSDPGAAASPSGANGVKKLQDLELAAPNAGVKKLEDQDPAAPSADKNPQATNAQDKKTDEVKSEEDSPVWKEIVKNPRAAKGGAEGSEEALVRQKIGGSEKSEVSPVRQKIGGGEKPEVAPVPQKTGGKKSEEAPVPLGNQELLEQSGAFAKSAAGTSMADAADFFRRAAESFVGGKDRKKRVTETELSKAAIHLFYVAQSAPSSELVAAGVDHLWPRGCESTAIEAATPGGHLSPGAHVTDPCQAREGAG